jgi:hypothetical protein
MHACRISVASSFARFVPCGLVGVALWGAAPAMADDLLLMPWPSVHRPASDEGIDDEAPPRTGRCAAALPAIAEERLPFGPGEKLSYDVAFLGMRTGKANLRVSEATTMDGVSVYPVQAQLKTDGFLNAFGNVDARMVTFLEPRTLLPTRMVNRVTTVKPFSKPAVSREDGAFAPKWAGATETRGGEVHGRLSRSGPDGAVTRRAKLATDADVLDFLSVIYALRARTVPEGGAFCFDLYHRRRLWRVEGKGMGTELVRAPLGSRMARRLEAKVRGLGKEPPPPRVLTAWISIDADRLPVLVSSPEGVGAIEVRLVGHERGRRLVRRFGGSR